MTLYERHLKASLETAAILLLSALALPTLADPDLWGHLRFGLDIIAQRNIPGADIYSFTSDRPFIDHEWLSDVVMAATYSLGGSYGLVTLKLCLLSVFTATTWLALRIQETRPLWRTLGVAATLIAGYPLFHTVRPQLWSIAGCSTLLLLLFVRQRRWLFAVPPLFVLWANFHGGWLIGLLVLVVCLASDVTTGRLRVSIAAMTIAASAGATLVNPYGYKLLTFLAETVRTTRADVTEWNPVYESTPYLVVWAVSAVALVYGAIRKPRLQLLAPVALAYLSWRVQRVTPFFTLVTMVTALPGGKASTREDAPFRGADRLAAGAICAAILAIAVVGFAAAAKASITCITLLADGPDRAAADHIERLGLRGRLVIWFDWGDYVIWRFGPRLQVSIDGRREAIYTAETLRRHMRFVQFGSAGWPELEEFRPDYAWLPRSLPAATRMGRGWTPLISTPRSIVWTREARSDTPIHVSALANDGCFPG